MTDKTSLDQLHASLKAMIDDPKVPQEVRAELKPEYEQLRAMLDKLEHQQVHIGVFGRVSVGKSSLLNALVGDSRFTVSPLHGETKRPEFSRPVEMSEGSVVFIDTPGIDEIDGEEREQQAREIASRCDLLLFVVEGDITASENAALKLVASQGRPVLLVLNKSDRYTREEQDSLLAKLGEHAAAAQADKEVVLASADPAPRAYIIQTAAGTETEEQRQPPPEIKHLKEKLWLILEREGKELAAINAGLFAASVSDSVAKRITRIKKEAGAVMIKRYCLAKGLSVAVNPVPVADLAAAAAIDVTMVYHLSHVYGLPMTRAQAGKLVSTIFGQLALLMGAVWSLNILSSALKTVSAGLSIAVTALGQGAVAWYATYVVGEAATRYLENGASWGEGGPKRAVKELLDSIDRESVLKDAKQELAKRLRSSS